MEETLSLEYVTVAKTNMISQQLRTWGVTDDHLLNHIAALSRENFLPPSKQAFAYADQPIITPDFFSLAPKELAKLLQDTAILPTDTILEISLDQGYTTSLLSTLGSKVTSVHFDEISLQAAKIHCSQPNCQFVHYATFSDLLADEQTYDVIFIHAALPEKPDNILRKLNTGGRFAAIIGNQPIMSAVVYKRESGQCMQELSLFETLAPYVPTLSALKKFTF